MAPFTDSETEDEAPKNFEKKEIKKKLKINDIVKVNIRGKINQGTIVNIGSTRASVIFEDGKKWYIPYSMIILK